MNATINRSMPTPPVDASAGGAALRFEAMGTRCHVVVNAENPLCEELVEHARATIDDLERRWSRFQPTSEVAALARFAGSWVGVSPATLELVDHAVLAAQLTGGRFDPTIDVARLGYDRPFAELTSLAPHEMRPGAGVSGPPAAGAVESIDIDHARCSIRIPEGVAFDPGGIGKGFAADRVTADLMRLGATGTLVNLGGDLRVRGESPDGGPWVIEVTEPAFTAGRLSRLSLADGAVATSTSLRRRWSDNGSERHHIVDPDLGISTPERPGDIIVATALASEGWWAEAVATASIGAPGQPLPDAHVLTGFADRTVERSERFSEYER